MRIVRILSYVFMSSFLIGIADAETGRVQGTVKDPAGKPIDKVTITIAPLEGSGSKLTTQTNSKGEYVHIGVNPGKYRLTPSKEGFQPVNYAYADLSVGLSEPAKADFVLQPVGKAVEKEKTAEESAQIKQAKEALNLLNAGKVDEGIEALKKAIAIDPNMPSVHYNLGLAYEKKDQHDEAQKEFQEAVKLKPDLGEAYVALGDSYMEAKKFDGATETFSKASTLMPQTYAAFYNLGASYSKLGKYAEAEQAFRTAATISPKEPVVHYQLAMALLGESKNADAKAEFQKYLELNPNAADKAEVEELMKTLQ